MRYRWKIDSPVGPLAVFSDGEHLVGLFFGQHSPAPCHQDNKLDAGPFRDLVVQLDEYFDGSRTEFTVPVHFEGTDFQMNVWQTLKQVPYGQTISYQDLATRCSRPTAARAVGAAVGRNPISIVNPCHRIVGADGKMTGFAGGLNRKRFLLRLEAVARGSGSRKRLDAN